MIYAIIILSVLYIFYLIFEYYYFQKIRKFFKHIIHVNGTRGKSTVTRMIGHILNENGFSVCLKTTGTIPAIIFPSGEEKELLRFSNPNIKEQLKVMRLAKKNGADVLVVECMAVTPKYQYLTHHKMLNADMTVITNVRLDHQEVLGKSAKEIAESFVNTISNNGVLFVGQNNKNYYLNEAKKRQTKVFTFSSYEGTQDIDLYGENIAAALKVGEYFNIAEQKVLSDLKNYKKDVGALKIYKFSGHTFINAFSINDTESLKITLEKINLQNIDVFLVNNRKDRAFRAKEHLKFLQALNFKKLIVAGGYYNYFKKNLKGVEVVKFKKVESLNEEEVVFGFGNFKKQGLKIVQYYNGLNIV